MDYTPLLVGRELRRIGVDGQRLGALVRRSSITSGDFLQWLRWLPTGLGHDAFMRRLAMGSEEEGMQRLRAGQSLPAADPNHLDAESDELLALCQELQRVAPDRGGPEGSGINFPRGRARALAVLRRLPSGAGIGAVTSALNGDRDRDV
jgi:hypothetical protein